MALQNGEDRWRHLTALAKATARAPDLAKHCLNKTILSRLFEKRLGRGFTKNFTNGDFKKAAKLADELGGTQWQEDTYARLGDLGLKLYRGVVVSVKSHPGRKDPARIQTVTSNPGTASANPAPAAELAAVPAAEPATVPATEPAAVPVAELAVVPAAEHAAVPTAPTAEPAAVPAAEPAVAPVTDPATAPAAEPAPVPAAPAANPAAAPDAEPAADEEAPTPANASKRGSKTESRFAVNSIRKFMEPADFNRIIVAATGSRRNTWSTSGKFVVLGGAKWLLE